MKNPESPPQQKEQRAGYDDERDQGSQERENATGDARDVIVEYREDTCKYGGEEYERSYAQIKAPSEYPDAEEK